MCARACASVRAIAPCIHVPTQGHSASGYRDTRVGHRAAECEVVLGRALSCGCVHVGALYRPRRRTQPEPSSGALRPHPFQRATPAKAETTEIPSHLRSAPDWSASQLLLRKRTTSERREKLCRRVPPSVGSGTSRFKLLGTSTRNVQGRVAPRPSIQRARRALNHNGALPGGRPTSQISNW